MWIFVDSANVDEIREALSLGLCDGVTTNPTLIAKEGKDFKRAILDICELTDVPVNAEVTSSDYTGIVREGRVLASWAPNVVVKIPFTPDGLKAVRILSEEGIETTVTLVFTAAQALLAAKAGATYICPFVGRSDDIAWEGMDFVGDIVQIYENYAVPTEVIVASVRHPIHVLEAARMGADGVTVPFSVIQKMMHHPLTDIGIKRFLEDAKKVGWKVPKR
ncbi:MAG TPA: fructose-6-phosphate aldolase [Proteobacteria bacterium]|nr:fructose-6-phosphate aldolase [Pseudomonadota bacterium]